MAKITSGDKKEKGRRTNNQKQNKLLVFEINGSVNIIFLFLLLLLLFVIVFLLLFLFCMNPADQPITNLSDQPKMTLTNTPTIIVLDPQKGP